MIVLCPKCNRTIHTEHAFRLLPSGNAEHVDCNHPTLMLEKAEKVLPELKSSKT